MGLEITGETQDEATRKKINEALTKDAQNSVLWLMTQSQNAYSQKLKETGKDLNRHLAADGNPVVKQAIIMDPAAFDTALALGFTPGQAAALSVGAAPPPKGSAQEAQYNYVAAEMMKSYTTKLGFPTDTQMPEEIPAGAACWIVPNDNRTDFINIKKLSADDEATYVNLHEAWHCRDTSNKFDDIPPAIMQQVSKLNRIEDLPDDAAARKAFARFNRQESLADVGALGEMIRNGHDPSIIGSVRQWRQETAWDTRHHTLTSIDAFQKKIDEMGVDKFRKLSDADARKLYVQVMEENALTEKSVEIIYRDKHSMLRNFLDNNVQWIDSDIRKARNFEISREATANGPNLIQKTMQAVGRVISGEDRKDASVAKQAFEWNALAALKDTAFKNSGKITPATMVAAYRDMQDKLCEDSRKHPENRQLDEEKMTKLREFFVLSGQKPGFGIDYAAENLKRGVHIEQVEPSLKSFLPKPAVATAAPKPKAAM